MLLRRRHPKERPMTTTPDTPPTPTAEEIARLRELLEAATPPPWTAQHVGPWQRGAIVDERQTELCDYPHERRADAELIVAARNALGPLLSALDRLQKREGEMREALADICDALTQPGEGRRRFCAACDHSWHADDPEESHWADCPSQRARALLSGGAG